MRESVVLSVLSFCKNVSDWLNFAHRGSKSGSGM